MIFSLLIIDRNSLTRHFRLVDDLCMLFSFITSFSLSFFALCDYCGPPHRTITVKFVYIEMSYTKPCNAMHTQDYWVFRYCRIMSMKPFETEIKWKERSITNGDTFWSQIIKDASLTSISFYHFHYLKSMMISMGNPRLWIEVFEQ